MKKHKGLTVTFWIVAAILGIHYFFIFLPFAIKHGNTSFADILGSLIVPTIILVIIWQIKRSAEKKLNKKD